jgi:hypothetical protein
MTRETAHRKEDIQLSHRNVVVFSVFFSSHSTNRLRPSDSRALTSLMIGPSMSCEHELRHSPCDISSLSLVIWLSARAQQFQSVLRANMHREHPERPLLRRLAFIWLTKKLSPVALSPQDSRKRNDKFKCASCGLRGDVGCWLGRALSNPESVFPLLRA